MRIANFVDFGVEIEHESQVQVSQPRAQDPSVTCRRLTFELLQRGQVPWRRWRRSRVEQCAATGAV